MIPSAADALRRALPDGVLSTDPETLTAAGTPWRGRPGRPLAVLRPRTTEEVSACVAAAVATGTRLIVQGANTGLVGAGVPDGSGTMAVLSTSLLREAWTLRPDDRTLTVSAGFHLEEVNERLARAGLWLPVELGADPCIGGLVATNAGGSRMFRYGDVRSRLRGVEMVVSEPPGARLVAGVGLRKDNRRLALHPLLAGSGGRLGVIVAATFEIEHLPRDRATSWVVPRDDDAAVTLTTHLETQLGPTLSAVEAVSPAALALLAPQERSRIPHHRADGSPGVILLVEATSPPGDQRDPADLLAVALDRAPPGVVLDAVFGPPHDLWAARHALTPALATAGRVLGHDVSVPRDLLPTLRRRLAEEVATHAPEAELVDFGHWGDGGLHANLLVRSGPPDPEREHSIRKAIYSTVEGLGGSPSAEHGFGPETAVWWHTSVDPVMQRTVEALERAFDPHGLFGHPLEPH